uniref:Uncharacterized protein n=1 Tax=Populus trichocarpa TaxID=3694 RepID=A0A2K2A5I7_POPTR
MRTQAWRRRKHLGGHCECFEKQAFEFIIIDLQKLQSLNYIFATQARKAQMGLSTDDLKYEKSVLEFACCDFLTPLSTYRDGKCYEKKA